MTDLIERYKITANLPSVMMNYCNRFNSEQIELIIEMIYELENSIESSDVQPVKHGRWIDCTFYDPYEKSYEQNYEFKCSNCGHKIYNKPNDDNLFCGHCGARMDNDKTIKE